MGLDPHPSCLLHQSLCHSNVKDLFVVGFQVELDRVEEELRMEIERNAMSEPASHRLMSEHDMDDTDVTSNDETVDSVRNEATQSNDVL